MRPIADMHVGKPGQWMVYTYLSRRWPSSYSFRENSTGLLPDIAAVQAAKPGQCCAALRLLHRTYLSSLRTNRDWG